MKNPNIPTPAVFYIVAGYIGLVAAMVFHWWEQFGTK